MPRDGQELPPVGVVFEVLVAVSRLVNKYGTELGTEWDDIVRILQLVLPVAASLPVRESTELPETARDMFEALLSKSISLARTGHFIASNDELFRLVEREPGLVRTETVLFVMQALLEQRCMPHSIPFRCRRHHDAEELTAPHFHSWLENLRGYFLAFFSSKNHAEARQQCLLDARRYLFF
jgi:hypothetical protein